VLEDGSEHGPGGLAALGVLQDALQDKDWGLVQREAERILRKRGVESADGQWNELCRALLKAQIGALQAALTRHRGEIPDLPEVLNSKAIDPVTFEIPSPARTKPRKGKSIVVSEAADRFLSERMRDPDARWTRQTELQYRTSCRLFADYVQNAPLDAVTREDAADFLTTLGRLHPNYGRSSKSKGLNLDQLLKLYGGKTGLSNATLNRHLRALNGLFKWAAQAGLYDNSNPFSGLHRSTGRRSRTGWQPFTVDELNALIRHPILLESSLEERLYPRKHTPQTALMWVPIIALFSGMREDEICGLRVTDVREEDGVLHFNVIEHEGRSVKSESAIRRVPVHSHLIEVGFGEYFNHVRKAGQTYLFPGLRAGGPDGKRNWYFSRAFTPDRSLASEGQNSRF
jgi:integrase